jgi:hypothetical protein
VTGAFETVAFLRGERHRLGIVRLFKKLRLVNFLVSMLIGG